MNEIEYQCVECKKIRKAAEGGKVPVCHGKPMVRFQKDICTQAPSAEHARMDRFEEPCDDGRKGSRE